MKSEDLAAMRTVTLSFMTKQDVSSIADIDSVVCMGVSAHQPGQS